MEVEKPPRQKYPSVTEMTDAEHVGLVREIFSTITEKYDFLNHLFILGQDISWRYPAAERMRFFRTYRFPDVATGTADLAIEAARRHSSIQVTGVDFVREMMDLGRLKIERDVCQRESSFSWVTAWTYPFVTTISMSRARFLFRSADGKSQQSGDL